MKYEHDTTSVQVSLLPNVRTGRSACADVWMRSVCVQPFLAGSDGRLLQGQRTHRIQRNSKTANSAQAAVGNRMAVRGLEHRAPTVFAQSRHSLSELLSETRPISDLQIQTRYSIGPLSDRRIPSQRRRPMAGQDERPVGYAVVAQDQGHSVQRDSQQGQGGTLLCFVAINGRSRIIAHNNGCHRYRLRIKGRHHDQRWVRCFGSEVLPKSGSEACESSTLAQQETKRFTEPCQSAVKGCTNPRHHSGQSQGLVAQNDFAVDARKPNGLRGEFGGKKHGQEPLFGEINPRCRMGRDRQTIGIQGQMVWSHIRADRPILPVKQAMFCLRIYSTITRLIGA